MTDDIPALQPPDGVQSNFINPYSLSGLVIAVFTVCMIISCITTCLHLYAQYRLYSRWTWADRMYKCNYMADLPKTNNG